MKYTIHVPQDIQKGAREIIADVEVFYDEKTGKVEIDGWDMQASEIAWRLIGDSPPGEYVFHRTLVKDLKSNSEEELAEKCKQINNQLLSAKKEEVQSVSLSVAFFMHCCTYWPEIGKRTDLTVDIREWMLKRTTKYNWTFGFLAENPTTPASFLEKMAFLPSAAGMHEKLAERKDLPGRARRKLITHAEGRVRMSAIYHWEGEIDDALATEICKDNYYAVRQTLVDKNVSQEILGILAKDSDPAVRELLAKRNTLPAHIQEIMAADRDVHVRGNLARRKDLSLKTLQILAQDDKLPIYALEGDVDVGKKLSDLWEDLGKVV